MAGNLLRVMVVDDEPEIARALRRLLRSHYEVETAGGGVEALEKLAAFQPDVVISDFRMPQMNGAELLAEVKRRSPLTLRLILSGNADLDAVLASVNNGEVCRFLRKPWDSDALLSLLVRLLNERQMLHSMLQPFANPAPGLIVEALQEEGRLVVNAHLSGKPFGAEDAIALIRSLTCALAEQQVILVGGLLERHAGKISFVAEVGGEQRLSLELPLREGSLTTAPHLRAIENTS